MQRLQVEAVRDVSHLTVSIDRATDPLRTCFGMSGGGWQRQAAPLAAALYAVVETRGVRASAIALRRLAAARRPAVR